MTALTSKNILFVIATLCTVVRADIGIITEPRPGEEYVFVQTSGQGAHPISRIDKSTDASNRPFETAHKIPAILTYKQSEEEVDDKKVTKVKREAAKAPIAAPPGSIKIDPLKLIEKYRSELATSTTNKPQTKATTRRTASRKPIRTKKEVATTPIPVLTTGAPATPRTLHIHDGGIVGAASTNKKLSVSGTENKRSKIQIKKGPNGQEYEYEYVYYYYDDDEEISNSKETVFNAHDGPQRNTVTNGRGKYNSAERTSSVHPEPAANEVVPVTRGSRQRGRQSHHDTSSDDKVSEERLPSNTRFPPRSRNIATTPSPSEDEEIKTTKKQRGKPHVVDNTPDETQVSGRGRNRSNVRRPSLELVDSASFNTHSSNDPAVEPYKEPKARGEHLKDSAGPSFPSELPDGPVRFLGATPNEKTNLQELKSRIAEDETNTDSVGDSVTTDEPTTTELNAMNKVALDLYAILQGTQKLAGEEETSTDETDSTTTDTSETTEVTTEMLTTEEITTPTTTTTTTTTTAAPTTTTTTTPEPATGRNRFRSRPGAGGNRFKSAPSTTTNVPEASTEGSAKPRGRFNSARPGFGNRARPGARTTTEATESEVTKEESKPASHSKPIVGGRSRFGGRGRTQTTSTANDNSESTTVASSSKPGLRPRPGFALRRRGQTAATAEPTTGDEHSEATSSSEPSTTAKPVRGRGNGSLVRPLRPGPRINLATRTRSGATSTTTTTAPLEQGAESESATDVVGEEKTSEATPPVTNGSPLNKLRTRAKLNVAQVRPKSPSNAPVAVRRTNPLLARRKPVIAPENSETHTEAAPEVSETEAAPASETETSAAPSSTTEEPRGLNKLLAGRKRIAARQPGTIL